MSVSHYSRAAITVDLQPIYLCRQLPFVLGNVVKYVLRAPFKLNEHDDLVKALDYLEMYIRDKEHSPGFELYGDLPWLDGTPDFLCEFRRYNSFIKTLFQPSGFITVKTLEQTRRKLELAIKDTL